MSQTAKDLLQSYGLSVADAAAFINSNLSNPRIIFDTAKKFGVTNQHLSEITGFATDVVKSFWLAQGLQPALLDADSASIQVKLVDIAIQKYTAGPYGNDLPVAAAQPVTQLNASSGSFKFIVEFNDFVEFDREIGRFYITGFGADDSFELHSPGYLLVGSAGGVKDVDMYVAALGGVHDGHLEIKLAGVTSGSPMLGVDSFNNLPVGNIYIV